MGLMRDMTLGQHCYIGGKIVKTEECCETFHFQMQLLLNIEELQRYPFTKMVIEKNLTQTEYEETMKLLKSLHETYIEEQEEGFLHHEPLLLHFAGMLCYKLSIEESIEAIYQEGMYPDLMRTLRKYVHN